jgi:hypothetical protein
MDSPRVHNLENRLYPRFPSSWVRGNARLDASVVLRGVRDYWDSPHVHNLWNRLRSDSTPLWALRGRALIARCGSPWVRGNCLARVSVGWH